MFRTHRVAVRTAAALFILLLISIFVISLPSWDSRILMEKCATHFIGRAVTIGNMSIRSVDPFQIEMKDVQVANAVWGSQPHMISIGHIIATLDLKPLLLGRIKFSQLILEDAVVTLERDKDGLGNWKSEKGLSHNALSPEEKAARSRKKLPTILDLAVRNSRITFRTSSGAILKIDFKNLALLTPDEDQPVILKVEGSYNDIPVQLDIQTKSFAVFHDATTPFGADIAGDAATLSLALKTQMMDPLNFDQLNGDMQIHIKKIGRAAGLFGGNFAWDVPLVLKGTLKRNGDDWEFSGAEGSFAGNIFRDSHLDFLEGQRFEPDIIKPTLNFDKIDLADLLKNNGEAESSHANQKIAFWDNPHPSALLDVQLAAKNLSYNKLIMSDFHLHGGLKRGEAALDDISMHIWDGTVHGRISAKTTKDGNVILAESELSDGKIKALVRSLGLDEHLWSGSIDAGFKVKGKGDTLEELEKTLNGAMAVSVVHATMPRQYVKISSLDLQTLISKDSNTTDISCALAVLGLENGSGHLSPFLLTTTDGILRGQGAVDLPGKTMDLTFKTDPTSTPLTALDLPIHISGNFDNLAIKPGLTSQKYGHFMQGGSMSGLPTSTREKSEKNPCFHHNVPDITSDTPN